MPILVEDGTGLSEADSYTGLTYGTTYAENRGWADYLAATDAARDISEQEPFVALARLGLSFYQEDVTQGLGLMRGKV